MKDRIKFTDTKIKSLKAKDGKRTEYYDDLVTGLIVRVTKTGHKSFGYRFWYNGQSKQITIGKFGDVTLGDARKEAKSLKDDVRKGLDPLRERQKKKEAPKSLSFRELSDIYDGIHLPTLRESSQKYHKWALDVKVLPFIGKMTAKEIQKQDIIKILDKIAIENDAKATANKVRSRLHHMFEFAISRGYLKQNPVSGTKPYEGGNNQRERFYNADEIRSVWEAVETLNEPVRSYIKIIMLTGQRRTETHKMKWENIRYEEGNDFEGWVWIIPKELAKSNREHEVQLSPLAVEIIENLKSDNPYVFSSILKNNIPIGLKTIKRGVKTIKDESEVSDFRLHDMRRTVATWLAKLGTPAEVVSKVLNHKTGGGGSLVTRIYNRYEYRAERQLALNKWASELQRIVTGESAKVHKLKKSS